MTLGLATRGYLDGGGGAGATYRMRAYDSTLARLVFWESTIVDSLGTEYTGPGPILDVVVQNVIGKA